MKTSYLQRSIFKIIYTFMNRLKNKSQEISQISSLITLFLWLLFIGNAVFLISSFIIDIKWYTSAIVRFNGFSVLIWTVVTFFSALISSYSKNYLMGFTYRNRFNLLALGFTIAVMLFVIANNLFLLVGNWFLMGFFISKLIGINKNWMEAKAASYFSQKYFLFSSFLLGIGILILGLYTEENTLIGLTSMIHTVPTSMTIISSLFIITAAIIQSAIFPFHRWLLSAMTAPTPASALMHAGFVNGSGILLALFSTLLVAANTLSLLFVIGGVTVIIGQFAKLLQVNVKQKLACSTIAQMGFMIMQCGLGFFNAAVLHLILHGFYKAYLFLSSGEEIEYSSPSNSLEIKIKPLQALIVLIYGIIGAVLFIFLTGKGTAFDGGILLTLIVAITVGQVTYNFVKEKSLSLIQKMLAPPILFIAGISVYAILLNGVTLLMKDTPLAVAPASLSIFEVVFGIVVLIGFFIMKLGVYRKYPWLYVKLLNMSQPYKKSIFNQ